MENAIPQQYDRFLTKVGILLVVLFGLGYLALGPTADNSIFGLSFALDANQNLIHLLFGLAALIAARWLSPSLQKVMATIIGVCALLAAIYSIYAYDFPAPNAMIAHINTPWETIFYTALGLWALWMVLMPAGPVFVKDQPAQK